MYEIVNASKNGFTAALSLGYLAILILLQYLASFLLMKNALALRAHAFH